MKTRPVTLPYLAAVTLVSAAATLAALSVLKPRKGRNRRVPQPAKPVDLMRYIGRWYELGRYENSFERGDEAVTANYGLLPNGEIEVVNSARKGGVSGRLTVIKGRARPVKGSGNAKLKVRFFGPFAGDYWVLDHDADYAWSIVGEPSGRFLWLLTRSAEPPATLRKAIHKRAGELGYEIGRIRPTQH